VAVQYTQFGKARSKKPKRNGDATGIPIPVDAHVDSGACILEIDSARSFGCVNIER